MADNNSEDSFVMEDIAYEDNDFEEDVQTALVHTDKVSHDRVPSARSSARSVHDSYAPRDSPILGERQVFSRPAEPDHNPAAYQHGGLPPLPEFAAYGGDHASDMQTDMQAGAANPLFDEDSAADEVVDDHYTPSGSIPPHVFGSEQAGLGYTGQHNQEAPIGRQSISDDAEAAESQHEAQYTEPQSAELDAPGDTSSQYYGGEQQSDLAYSQQSAAMMRHTGDAASAYQPQGVSDYDSPEQPAMISGQPRSRSQSARSTTDVPNAYATSAGVADSRYGLNSPPAFVPSAYPPASRSQSGLVSYASGQHSTNPGQPSVSASRRSSDQPVPSVSASWQNSDPQAISVHASRHSSEQQEPSVRVSRRSSEQQEPSVRMSRRSSEQQEPSVRVSRQSSEQQLQPMQPLAGQGIYEAEEDYQQPAAAAYASSSQGYGDEEEEDYSHQYAAQVSRPQSAQARGRDHRGVHSRGHPPRPPSPGPGEYYDEEEDIAGSKIPAYQPRATPPTHPASPRSRPGSAVASRGRLEAAVQQSMQYNVADWGVSEVCDWSDYIGLGQYRKKFVHHCIDGRLLLRLTYKDLKEELGIAPLGHRQGFMMAMSDLAAFNDQTHGGTPPQHPPMPSHGHSRRGRPQSAPGGRGYSPARGAREGSDGSVSPERGVKELHALKALELREHLMHEMQKAQARAAHRQAVAGRAVHNAQLAGTETKKLKGQIYDLERQAGLRPLIRPSSGVGVGNHRMGDSLDVLGHIPWHPAGKGRSTTPLCKAGPEMSTEATFQPHINQHSLDIMQERRGSTGSASFLNRLEADLHGRKMRLQHKAEQLHSREARFGDPRIAQKEAERDSQFLREYVQVKTGQDLPREGADSALDEILGSYKSELGLSDKEGEQLEHLQGSAKAQRLVAMLRSHQFMERYQAEIAARDERIKESKRLGREVPKKTRMTAPEAKANTDEADVKKCAAHFEMCGWDALEFDASSGGPDKKFDAVVKRVRAQQEAQDKSNAATQASKAASVSMLIPDAKVDWTKFSSDGLESLQASQMKKEAGKAGSKEEEGRPARHTLNWTVHLLAACRKDDIDKLEKWQGVPRCVAMYRAINSQRFLEFTKEDLKKREEKHEQAMKALEPHRKLLSKQDADKFFDRLMNDTEKRKTNRAEMIRKAREAEDKKIADFLATQKHNHSKHRTPRRAH